VFELGETDGQHYIVMEYLEGISLLPMLRRFSKETRPLELGFVAGVFQQVADAMNYAHELKDRDGEYLGIIHRDVTPSNVFVTETGVAKVLDFGIAKARGASTQTQEGTVKGKYAYMAPEQLKGAGIDRRVDIFAMGVVLYEMLALRRLFQRKTDYLTFRAVMEQPIADIRKYRADVPEGVALAIQRALDRNVANRFDTARQFGAAVLDGLGGMRPWSQGEISDFVHSNFELEISKRTARVRTVVQRSTPGMQRSTMPLLVHSDEGQHEGDGDDDEFPSVETEIEGTPPWRPTPLPSPPNAGSVTDFAANTGSGTPPPFADGPTGTGMGSIRPFGVPQVGNGTQSNIVVVQQKRSILWPLVAVAMVAVAAGALFLVWQQMQKQQPPAEIKITQESAIQPAPDPDKGTATTVEMPSNAAGSDPGSGSATAGSADVAEPKQEPKQAPKASGKIDGTRMSDGEYERQVGKAVTAIKRDLVSCLVDHRDAIPKSEMIAKLTIEASGKASVVQFAPESVNAGPLGTCLRNVLQTGNYPTARKQQIVNLPLKPKA
jgi:serine/threonine-protein kinase